MTREEKAKIISQLQDEFSGDMAIVVADFKGLTTKKLEALRDAARAADVKVQIIKNTLASIALKNSNKDGITLSKVAAKFAEANAEFFKLKAAHIDGEVTDAAKVVALSKLPSKDELIAMLLQVWNAPLQNFVIGLNALKDKKEQTA